MSGKQQVEEVVARARRAGREVLLEPEAMAIVELLGFAVPTRLLVEDLDDLDHLDLSQLPGDRVVLKVLSAEIVHKSDVGGVAIVPRQRAALRRALETMRARLGDRRVEGYALDAFIATDGGLDEQLLLGVRWTDAFGAVVTMGLGGLYAEFIASGCGSDRGLATLSATDGRAEVARKLRDKPFCRLLVDGARGQPPRSSLEQLVDLVERLQHFALRWMPEAIAELEINPLILRPDRPVALDALVRLGHPRPTVAAPRPLDKMPHLLAPGSVAVIGVSEAGNPGQIIVDKLLAQGFGAERITVVKPGRATFHGCACVPDLASLPRAVDLLIVSLAADRVPAIIEQAIAEQRAESVILLPGGLGERPGSEPLGERLEALVEQSRGTRWRGPLINGANCLGIRSQPGGYDTTFIPAYKLPPAEGPPAPLALISQSGALAIAQTSKLEQLHPRYIISVGNQLDLTVADFLTHLESDEAVEVFVCYVEGFTPLEGRRWLERARAITSAGRDVILYLAGRNAAGAEAAASHTASVAGDFAVMRELGRAAGAIVVDSLEDLQHLIRLCCLLRSRRPAGWRLGALSNAGFECVAIADNLGRFQLAHFAPATIEGLRTVLRDQRLQTIVDVRNPLDLTPITDDRRFVRASRLMLEDPGVDLGLIGCVPLSGALQTLPPAADHAEDLAGARAIGQQLAALARQCPKPWVAVIDAGPLYDPLARFLDAHGIPTFRSADRAMRLLRAWCDARLGRCAASG